MVRPFRINEPEMQRYRAMGYATVRLFWHDAYTILRTTRPEGWHDGIAAETADEVETGVGKLYESGTGNDMDSGGVIIGLAPYRFRMDATTDLRDTGSDLMVINGREFLVQSVTRSDEGDEIADVYLQERTEGGG